MSRTGQRTLASRSQPGQALSRPCASPGRVRPAMIRHVRLAFSDCVSRRVVLANLRVHRGCEELGSSRATG